MHMLLCSPNVASPSAAFQETKTSLSVRDRLFVLVPPACLCLIRSQSALSES
jgi:hypothetical protein